ncbi:unnamed protein product [Candidula unifasciata]|uniref:FAS1 domain-containing protein n=1 Tax=Candidula unifasciata TaxID=100452 RepID=A0A8S3ZUB8_9EUPU|nr:unnamed protein product [Candidula unifasciata]
MMSSFAYMLLFCMFAAGSFAFPNADSLLQRVKYFEKEVALEMDLSARLLTEGVLRFEAEQQTSDSSIPDLVKSLGLTTLLDLVVKAGLAPTLSGPGPFTVFGPTNEAFKNLPEWAKTILANKTVLANVLKFHVLPGNVPSTSLKDELLVNTALPGKKLRVNIYSDSSANGVTVVTTQCAPIDLKRIDKKASNGLVHVLNSVMIPPLGNIVESVVACPVFKTLVTAVKVAGLVDALSGDGPLTLFAPTDKAFKKLPPGVLNRLLKNVTALQQVLEYHVVPETYCSAGLATGLYKELTTLIKQKVTINLSRGGVTVNDAKVIVADGSVSNGVVHAIDTVLIPPGMI